MGKKTNSALGSRGRKKAISFAGKISAFLWGEEKQLDLQAGEEKLRGGRRKNNLSFRIGKLQVRHVG